MRSNRRTTNIDTFIGARLRERRAELHISQSELAARIGLTFQQVQKYERGDNRISASRLYEIAQALGVDVSYFYADLPLLRTVSESHEAVSLHLFVTTEEGMALVRAYATIADERLRRRLLDLMQALSEDAKRRRQ